MDKADSRMDPQTTLTIPDDKIHCQKQDRWVKTWHKFVLYHNKLPNCPLLLVIASHKLETQESEH